MRKVLIALLIAAIGLGGAAMAAGYRIHGENAMNFGYLLVDLLHAYETPSPGDADAIALALESIGSISREDREVAQAIADHWNRVYVNADGAYQPRLYDGGERATALEGTAIPDREDHAFVVLGFELSNGEMTDELRGRCDAAAAAARSFPHAILVCSGGPTGDNNPLRFTEAGLMKDYLTARCGIDPDRIFIDERAMSTVDNAVNTFAILQSRGVRTITLVTSAYHQRWGQVLYNAMAAMVRQATGLSVEIVENYSYDIPVREAFVHDDRWAVRQLATMLRLPDRVIDAMKKAF